MASSRAIMDVLAERREVAAMLNRRGLFVAERATSCVGNNEQAMRDFHVMRFHRGVLDYELRARGAA